MGRGGLDDDERSCLKVTGSVCFGIAFIIAAGLVGGSFNTIEPNEYGVLQNTISKELTTTRVYSSGRFFTGELHMELVLSFSAIPWRNAAHVYQAPTELLSDLQGYPARL
jgi:hypothetical protein